MISRFLIKRRPGRLAEYDSWVADIMVASLGASVGRPDAEKVDREFKLDFRTWPDEEMAELIARNSTRAEALRAASELRMREAWRAPAKWSLFIALASLGIAAIALVRTF